jgi:hypothetical protein
MLDRKGSLLLFLLIVLVFQNIQVSASFLSTKDEPGDDPKNSALEEEKMLAEEYKTKNYFLNYDEAFLKEMKVQEEDLKKKIEDLKKQDVPLNLGKEDDKTHERLRELEELLSIWEQKEGGLIEEKNYLREQKASFEKLRSGSILAL